MVAHSFPFMVILMIAGLTTGGKSLLAGPSVPILQSTECEPGNTECWAIWTYIYEGDPPRHTGTVHDCEERNCTQSCHLTTGQTQWCECPQTGPEPTGCHSRASITSPVTYSCTGTCTGTNSCKETTGAWPHCCKCLP